MKHCAKCNKSILEPGVAYGINPLAICNCLFPQPEDYELKIVPSIAKVDVSTESKQEDK